MDDDVDATDRGILYLLQQNARDATTIEMASAVDVAPSTVRNRIDRLEERGEGAGAELVWAIVGAVVLTSIVVHGVTATPVVSYVTPDE